MSTFRFAALAVAMAVFVVASYALCGGFLTGDP